MKKNSPFWGLVAILVLLGGQVAFGQDMTETQKNALESVGVPMYPGSSFLTADEDGHVVLWFSSADEPDTIMDWYEENLPDWSAATIGSTRVVYKGPAGLEQEEIMALPYLFVMPAEKLGNDPDDDNEITLRIPGSP
jgi:hypothetical protein